MPSVWLLVLKKGSEKLQLMVERKRYSHPRKNQQNKIMVATDE